LKKKTLNQDEADVDEVVRIALVPPQTHVAATIVCQFFILEIALFEVEDTFVHSFSIVDARVNVACVQKNHQLNVLVLLSLVV